MSAWMRKSFYLYLGFMFLTLLIGISVIGFGWVHPAQLQTWIASFGANARLVYIMMVVALELLWLPRMWGLFLGGILFGPFWGCGLSFVGDLLGGLICYVIARGGGREWVQNRLLKMPRARRIAHLFMGAQPLLMISILRICPVAHYSLVSYLAGLLGVNWLSFIIGTALGILPAAILYPMLGSMILKPTSPFFGGSLGLFIFF